MARFSIIAVALVLVASVTANQAAFIRFIDDGSNALNDTMVVTGDAGFIEIGDYSLTIETPIASATGGAGAGKTVSSPLHFQHKVDRNTAKFFQYQLSGKPFDTAVLKVVNNNNLVAKYTLSTVTIIDQAINASAGADSIETISMTFRKLQMQISTVQADGSATPGEVISWNTVSNEAIPVGGS